MKIRRSTRSWMIEENPDTTRKELTQMKKRKGLRSWMCIMALAAALIGMSVLLSQAPVHAGVDCSNASSTTDSDLDGFTDYQECNGITLGDNTLFPGKNSGLARANRLDPDTEDLFVILVPAAPTSYFPTNPLQYVSNPMSQGGLGITVHQISQTQVVAGTDRNVTSTQKAVRVTESLDVTSPNVLGFSNTGTPDGLDLATVYTQRIINFIKSVCGSSYGTSNCADSTGVYDNNSTGNLALTQKYITHTINHEVGHMLGPLAPVYNANYGGYHYKSGTNVIMDQSVYYTSKGGKVTFYSGTSYTSADQAKVKLK